MTNVAMTFDTLDAGGSKNGTIEIEVGADSLAQPINGITQVI
jgi:hypothetical protein